MLLLFLLLSLIFFVLFFSVLMPIEKYEVVHLNTSEDIADKRVREIGSERKKVNKTQCPASQLNEAEPRKVKKKMGS